MGVGETSVHFEVRSIPKQCNPLLVRKHHVACLIQDRVILYGGVTRDPEKPGQFVSLILNDQTVTRHQGRLPSIDIFRSGELRKTDALPFARSGHCAAVVTLNRKFLPSCRDRESVEGVLIIGGWGGQKIGAIPDDIWFLDPFEEEWHRPLFTGRTTGACNFASVDPLRHKGKSYLALFRGGDGVSFFNDLFLLDLAEGHWRAVDSPEKKKPARRSGHATVSHEHLLFLTGGWDGTDILGDFWMYSLSKNTWTCLDSANPSLQRTDGTISVIDDYLCLIGGRGSFEADDVILKSNSIKEIESEKVLRWKSIHLEERILKYAHRAISRPGCLCLIGGMETIDDRALRQDPGGSTPPNGRHDPNGPKFDPGTESGSVRHVASEKVHVILIDQQLGFLIPHILGRPGIIHKPIQFSILERHAGTKTLSDVAFDSGGVIIPAHRLALVLNSEVFSRMFSSKMNGGGDRRHPILAPSHVPAAVFEIFIRSLYSGDLASAILRQKIGPWCFTSDRQIHASLVSFILATVNRSQADLLQRSNDPVDHLRVTIPDELLSSVWPANSLPFNRSLQKESTEIFLHLLQLGDEYGSTLIMRIVEVVLGCLLSEENYDLVLQSAIVFRAQGLKDFAEWLKRRNDKIKAPTEPPPPISALSILKSPDQSLQHLMEDYKNDTLAQTRD